MTNTEDKKARLRKKFKVFSAAVKLLLLLVIIIGIPIYIYFCHNELIDQFSSVENVKAFFDAYKTQSIFVYIIVQAMQIIICIIPGQWLQFAGGYMYGFWLAYLWSLIGAFIGTVVTYYLAKLLGHDAMHLIFGKEKIKELLKTLNSKKAIILVFLVYLIPGVPKDLCSYVAGLSEFKLKPFLIVSLIGRSPAMMGSLLIGKLVGVGGYTSAIIIGVISVILFALGLIFRKKITNFIDKAYDKLMKM